SDASPFPPAVTSPTGSRSPLAEAFGGRADNRDLLFDRLEEAFVGRELLLGIAIANLGLVDVGLGVVEVVLEERLGLFLVGEDERARDLFLQQIEVFLVQRVLEEFEILLARVVRQIGL